MTNATETNMAGNNLTEDQLGSLNETIARLDYYMMGVCTITISLLGLVGNMLTIIVLTRRTMRSSTNCYLTALAIWDSIVLVGTLLLMSLPSIWPLFRDFIFAYIIAYMYPLALIAQTATIWLTVSFTVERFIAVRYPLKAASMCTINRARIVIVIVSVYSILFNICRWFEYNIDYKYDASENLIQIASNATDLGSNEMYLRIYFFYFYLPFMCVIPMVALLVINTFLIYAVKKSRLQRKDMNVRQSRENNVTIMLVSVVIVFIFCQVPALIYNMAYAFNRESILMHFSWQILSILRNFLVNVNSSVNFILYCAFGQKFRKIFMRTFCRYFLKEDEFHSITYQGTGNLNSTVHKKYMKIMQQNDANKKYNVKDRTSSTTVTRTTILSHFTPQSSFDSSGKFYRNKQHNNDSVKVYKKVEETNFLIPESEQSDVEDKTDIIVEEAKLAEENASSVK